MDVVAQSALLLLSPQLGVYDSLVGFTAFPVSTSGSPDTACLAPPSVPRASLPGWLPPMSCPSSLGRCRTLPACSGLTFGTLGHDELLDLAEVDLMSQVD